MVGPLDNLVYHSLNHTYVIKSNKDGTLDPRWASPVVNSPCVCVPQKHVLETKSHLQQCWKLGLTRGDQAMCLVSMEWHHCGSGFIIKGGVQPPFLSFFPYPSPSPHPLAFLPSVMGWCSKKALTRHWPLSLDFPASETVRNTFVHIINSSQSVVFYSCSTTEDKTYVIPHQLEGDHTLKTIDSHLESFQTLHHVSSFGWLSVLFASKKWKCGHNKFWWVLSLIQDWRLFWKTLTCSCCQK